MSGPHYVADAAERTRRVELDGLTALFHLPSGMTHLLAPPAPQILDTIANNPADVVEILRRMSTDFDLDGGEEAILARLAELEASGLVWRTGQCSPAKAGGQNGAGTGPRLSPGNASGEPRDRAA